MAIETGDIVGDYRVLGAIGAGGMGAVYRVEHLITRRVEAMKAIPTGFGVTDEEIRGFEREIQVQARLQHPNIAAVYSAVRHGDTLALVMEHVEGESLRQRLERGRLPLNAALAIAADVLGALECAHRHGVVHGDVSPANIMVTPSGRAKLTDFGLARDGTAERGGDSGMPVGTAWYMAPEQVRGIDGVDARSDLYSAGAVLHEILTGRKVFEGESAFVVMQAHVAETPKPPSAFRGEIPASLDRVIAKALAKEPARRFQSATEFREAIFRVAARRRTRKRLLIACAAVAAVVICGAAVAGSKRAHVTNAAPRSRVISTPPAAPAPSPKVEAAPAEPAEPAVQPSGEKAPSAIEAPRRPARAKTSAPKVAAPAEVAVRGENLTTPPPSRFVTPEWAMKRYTAPSTAEIGALPVAANPAAVAAPAIPLPSAEAPKPQKTGNRFLKALGKINPFRRGSD